MSEQQILFFNLCFLLVLLSVAEGSEQSKFRPKGLFVFGDSYGDTGNSNRSTASSWRVPYGMTFPGRPAGRFSDGRILTDYLASHMGLKSPLPYRCVNAKTNRTITNGINFAYGGTGVFDTNVAEPNMTTQIHFFKRIIGDEKLFTPADINSSVALLSLVGNDYQAYRTKHVFPKDWKGFITQVVNQLAVNMKLINGVGVRKIVTTSLHPVGCLPGYTRASSFKRCNETVNQLVLFHNLLLKQSVEELNSETKDSPFIILDLFTSFLMFLRTQEQNQETKSLYPLKPCCLGTGPPYSCGSMDENRMKKYTYCGHPNSTFFWDEVHPTQAAWHSVFSVLKNTLQEFGL